MTTEQFITYLKFQIELHGSQKAFAQWISISEQYLTDVLKRRRQPGKKILTALGFRRIVTYEQERNP